uniref:Uncharacterized protein n=1 Tax=Solanum lycopersicum TaxID=4081 RepID=K4CJQ6_SOLLC
MDRTLRETVIYHPFPLRFDGIDRNDRYANSNSVFFDIYGSVIDDILTGFKIYCHVHRCIYCMSMC